MSGITNLYDAATQIEDALAAIFTANGLTAATPRSAAEFQKARPRVEVMVELSEEKKSYYVFPDGRQRNGTWNGQIKLKIVAPSGGLQEDGTVDASNAHREYRAMVAHLMADMQFTLNGTDEDGEAYLPYHKIQRIGGSAFVASYKPEKGVEISEPIFSLEFGIDHGAWAEIGLTPVN